ncbi:MAG TPA: hypothetical protein DCM24_05680 [Synergistaceae bacterium]|nr:hypothetical protein [Synergistaceae bacterium]
MREPVDDGITASKRGAHYRLPAFRASRARRAYTLIETAVVLSIVIAVSFTLSPIVTGLISQRAGSELAARAEARNMARWIERTFQKACLHRRAFNVKYLSGFRQELLILWFNPSEYERYQTNGRCLVYFKSTSTQDRCYTPAWHTMTPAFTLYVYTPGKSKKKIAEIAVSGYCSVSLTEFP